MKLKQTQTTNIMRNKWDILIILDACRFDSFEKCFREYLKNIGRFWVLYDVISPATYTRQWLVRTWKDKYPDITYISANPYCNSMGYTPKALPYPFDGRDHFGKIVDVWNLGWNRKQGRVAPEQMLKFLLEQTKFNTAFFNKKERYVLHFQQPHAPYIFKEDRFKAKKPQVGTPAERFEKDIKVRARNPLRPIAIVFQRFLPQLAQFRLMQMFPFLTKWLFAKKKKYLSIYELYSHEEIIEAYEENLKWALKTVRNIVDIYPGRRIIITADHGELLGEYKRFGHGGMPCKELMTVPYMVIEPVGIIGSPTEVEVNEYMILGDGDYEKFTTKPNKKAKEACKKYGINV